MPEMTSADAVFDALQQATIHTAFLATENERLRRESEKLALSLQASTSRIDHLEATAEDLREKLDLADAKNTELRSKLADVSTRNSA